MYFQGETNFRSNECVFREKQIKQFDTQQGVRSPKLNHFFSAENNDSKLNFTFSRMNLMLKF